MRTLRLVLVVVFVLALVGAATANADTPQVFVAQLSGDQEVPARDTLARGAAVFQLSADGTGLQYRLVVANIDNVVASHIHCAPAGQNGPVGVSLFGGGSFSGSGILAEATITAPNPGNGCGWTTLADVVAAVQSGDTYVNVHTNDGADPPNTGPGDFPGGEIRGQIH